MTLEWSGSLAASLARIEDRIRPAAAAGLKKAADGVLRDSNALAPRDTGDLVASGKVVTDDLRADISYTSKHAVPQHEKTQYRHPGGGQAKFLQTALDDNRDQILNAVAAHIRGVLGG